MKVKRDLEEVLIKAVVPGKVIMLLGARRTGKTVLLNIISAKLSKPLLWLNGEDISTIDWFTSKSVVRYKAILGDTKTLIIDEAQHIPEAGACLKLLVDSFPELNILVTGSSAFDLTNKLGEPLTGRKKTYFLYPISESELAAHEQPIHRTENLKQRLVYGSYPELLHLSSNEEKKEYLNDLVNDYLLKDIIAFDTVKNSGKVYQLLQLIAYQVGSEVSYHELGKQLGMSKNTVEKYLDILSKVYVLHELGGFSRNLRKEITKSKKWYFLDNGLRNALIKNYKPFDERNDKGILWENYVIAERVKWQNYNRQYTNNYFWRTYDQQEIDWVEDRDGELKGYEMKWKPKAEKVPLAWKKTYKEATFQVIHSENYFDWVTC